MRLMKILNCDEISCVIESEIEKQFFLSPTKDFFLCAGFNLQLLVSCMHARLLFGLYWCRKLWIFIRFDRDFFLLLKKFKLKRVGEIPEN